MCLIISFCIISFTCYKLQANFRKFYKLQQISDWLQQKHDSWYRYISFVNSSLPSNKRFQLLKEEFQVTDDTCVVCDQLIEIQTRIFFAFPLANWSWNLRNKDCIICHLLLQTNNVSSILFGLFDRFSSIEQPILANDFIVTDLSRWFRWFWQIHCDFNRWYTIVRLTFFIQNIAFLCEF
jgi:hypothetical protein